MTALAAGVVGVALALTGPGGCENYRFDRRAGEAARRAPLGIDSEAAHAEGQRLVECRVLDGRG